MVKVGDIIDGRIVTRVYDLCGGIAYDTAIPKEPKAETVEAETIEAPKKKRVGRKKKEQ